MQTKLTLRMERDLVRSAKAYAQRRGTSVSRMVADFFTVLGGHAAGGGVALTPTVRRLLGAMEGHPTDERDHRRHLERKHR